MKIESTEHALQRIEKRKLTEDEVIEIIKHPESIEKKHHKYLYKGKISQGRIEVCCERTESIIKVITVHWI